MLFSDSIFGGQFERMMLVVRNCDVRMRKKAGYYRGEVGILPDSSVRRSIIAGCRILVAYSIRRSVKYEATESLLSWHCP